MTEEELLSLCIRKPKKCGIAPWIFWPPEQYSHGNHIRDFAKFPSWLPLCVYSDHSGGIVGTEIPAKHEMESDAPAFLTYSPGKAKVFKQMTGRDSAVILSPTVYYRRKNNIVQDETHCGTIAFPAHSTPGYHIIANFDDYARSLKMLPEKYHPITVCIHMCDIETGLHRLFQGHGFEVVTAGHISDYAFAERFYSLLRRHSYATSNIVGSYASLSIEMGIPFFIYGDADGWNNVTDENHPVGMIDLYHEKPNYKHLHESLKYVTFNGGIDSDIREFIECRLGIHDGIDPDELRNLLWKSFFKYTFAQRNLLKVIRASIDALVRYLFGKGG